MDSAPALRLDLRASGLRHLRFARETLGSLDGHLALAPSEETQLREALTSARAELASAVDALSAAVKSYRDFLERTRTRVRGRVRAAQVWGHSDVDLLGVYDRDEREPRRVLVRERVAILDTVLARVLAMLSPWPAVAASVLPPLADPFHVADLTDDDDDATR